MDKREAERAHSPLESEWATLLLDAGPVKRWAVEQLLDALERREEEAMRAECAKGGHERG